MPSTKSTNMAQTKSGKIQLSCGDHTFPLLDHQTALNLIASLGFEAADICLMGNRSHLRPENIRGKIPELAADLRHELTRLNLVASDVFCIPWTDFTVMAPNHPSAEERQRSRSLFLEVVEFATRIEAPSVTMLPGVDFDALGHEGSLVLAAEELQWRAEHLRKYGMHFSVECHYGSVAASPDDAARLISLAPDLGLTLDYTHFVGAGYSTASVHPLVPRATHLHFRGGRPGQIQSPMSDNVIDYEEVMDVIIASDYEGYLCVEYVWVNWEGLNRCDNVSETILMRDRVRAKLAGVPWSYPQ
jgi:sugar phosphate isomerase/epimerase